MIEAIVGVVGMGVLAIVWGIRQEGRITVASEVLRQRLSDNDKYQTQRVDALKELINTKFDGIDDRLERMERAMNGYLRGGGHV